MAMGAGAMGAMGPCLPPPSSSLFFSSPALSAPCGRSSWPSSSPSRSLLSRAMWLHSISLPYLPNSSPSPCSSQKHVVCAPNRHSHMPYHVIPEKFHVLDFIAHLHHQSGIVPVSPVDLLSVPPLLEAFIFVLSGIQLNGLDCYPSPPLMSWMSLYFFGVMDETKSFCNCNCADCWIHRQLK